jgi:hypothetical protein
MTDPTRKDRQRVLATLRDFAAETASLREALRGNERAIERACRQVEAGVPLHQVMQNIGVADLRAGVLTRLTRFEAAGHRMRVACFRLSQAEGLSIGEISRLWGLSRQLVSRMIKAPDATPPSSDGQGAFGSLTPRLRAMTKGRSGT